MLKKQLNRELVTSFRTVKTFFFQFGTNIYSRPYAKCSIDAFYFCVHRAKAWRAREPFAKDFLQFRENSSSCASTICQPFHVITPVLCAPKRTQLQTRTQIQTSFKSKHSSLCIHYSNSTALPCMKMIL
jgi:hypothetical protein